MNIEKDKKSNVTKQRHFLDDWLGDPLFKDWLDKDKNDNTVAWYFVCSKTISLSTAGCSVLVEHGNGTKYQTTLGKRNSLCDHLRDVLWEDVFKVSDSSASS